MLSFKFCTPLSKNPYLLWLFITFTLPISLFAQKSDTLHLQTDQILLLKDTIYFGIKDSIIIIKDNSKYKIKKEKAKTQKLLFEGYMSLIQHQQSSETELEGGEILETRKYFEPYKGKVIRKIYYKQVDLLEGSVLDPSLTAITDFGKLINNLHVNTRPWVIKNSLRFKENDKLNDVIMAENERLLRDLSYIEDAKIYIQLDNLSLDSVDVFIVTKDNFPIGAGLNYKSITNFLVEPYTKNMLGLGHEARLILEYNKDSTTNFGYGFQYGIENIRGSFIRSTIKFLNLTGLKQRSLNLSKPFSTNDVKFGGEIDLTQIETVRSWREYGKDTIYDQSKLYKLNTFDIWLGKSFFPNKNIYDQFFNFGIRYFSENYLDRPYVEADSNMLFHDNNSTLASITYKKINYFKTNRLLGYGIPEDIPIGYSINITGGYRKYEFIEIPYIGFSASWTNTTKKQQYYLTSLDFRGSPSNGELYDNILSAKVIFFSPLHKIKRFEIRNTLVTSFLSINNPIYLNKINFGGKIRKLNQDLVYGYSIITLRFESYIYTPYSFAGFKTAFSIFADSGLIASKEYLKGEINYYGSCGFSIQIKNESLTIPTLSVQFAYFPNDYNQGSSFNISFNFSDLRFLNSVQTLKPNPNFVF